MKTSLVTIVKNRTPQLENLIAHLEVCDPLPDELVVVWMASPSQHSLMQSDKFKITHKFVTYQQLPIASARNKGMQEAENPVLGYIAVDALPARDFIRVHIDALEPDAVVVSQRYRNISESELYLGYDHCLNQLKDEDTAATNGTVRINDCAALFFIRQNDFDRTGGFDESFGGFGINDEDFFTNCESIGMAIKKAPTTTFHQQRANYSCPFNHLLDFARNAQIFHDKWGFYPDKKVLSEYAKAGCINEDYESAGIHIERLPTDAEVKTARIQALSADRNSRQSEKA